MLIGREKDRYVLMAAFEDDDDADVSFDDYDGRFEIDGCLDRIIPISDKIAEAIIQEYEIDDDVENEGDFIEIPEDALTEIDSPLYDLLRDKYREYEEDCEEDYDDEIDDEEDCNEIEDEVDDKEDVFGREFGKEKDKNYLIVSGDLAQTLQEIDEDLKKKNNAASHVNLFFKSVIE